MRATAWYQSISERTKKSEFKNPPPHTADSPTCHPRGDEYGGRLRRSPRRFRAAPGLTVPCVPALCAGAFASAVTALPRYRRGTLRGGPQTHLRGSCDGASGGLVRRAAKVLSSAFSRVPRPIGTICTRPVRGSLRISRYCAHPLPPRDPPRRPIAEARRRRDAGRVPRR